MSNYRYKESSSSQNEDQSQKIVSKSSQQEPQFQLPINQQQLTIKTIKAEKFIIRIPTHQPKQSNHLIYGDKINKILKKSADSSKYCIQWQNKTRQVVTMQYLKTYHKELFSQFEIDEAFKAFLKKQNKQTVQEINYIVID